MINLSSCSSTHSRHRDGQFETIELVCCSLFSIGEMQSFSGSNWSWTSAHAGESKLNWRANAPGKLRALRNRVECCQLSGFKSETLLSPGPLASSEFCAFSIPSSPSSLFPSREQRDENDKQTIKRRRISGFHGRLANRFSRLSVRYFPRSSLAKEEQKEILSTFQFGLKII